MHDSENKKPLIAFPIPLLIGPVLGIATTLTLLGSTAYSAVEYHNKSWPAFAEKLLKEALTNQASSDNAQGAAVHFVNNGLANTGWMALQCFLLVFIIARVAVGLHMQVAQLANSPHTNKYYSTFFPLVGVAGSITFFAMKSVIPDFAIAANSPANLGLAALFGAGVVSTWYALELAFYNNRSDSATYKTDSLWWRRFAFDSCYGALTAMASAAIVPEISSLLESWLGIEFYPAASAASQIAIGYAIAQVLYPVYLSLKEMLEECGKNNLQCLTHSTSPS